jgi:NAD(P)-dependent dehydrogenase (short-subunit alcohol dehydrogenase family)
MGLKAIDEQVVVVVGASSGIGREAALRFAQKGAQVVVAARNEEGLRSLVEEIRQQGGEAEYVVADVSDYEQVEAIADRAIEAYGRIDTWVHMAGVALYALMSEMTPEEFKQVIEINLLGQAYGAMAALPHLKREGRGALIHTSSALGVHSVPLQSAYDASKHGIIGMADALRMELQHEGQEISVTTILPSSINTPLFSKGRTKLGVKPRPIPPVYEPGVAADAILFAAEHPRREIYVGGGARLVSFLDGISPRIMDLFFLLTSFQAQRTDEPKSVDAPDNLFGPVEGHNTVRGDFGAEAKDHSIYTWLQTHPLVTYVVAGTVVGGFLLMGFGFVRVLLGIGKRLLGLGGEKKRGVAGSAWHWAKRGALLGIGKKLYRRLL